MKIKEIKENKKQFLPLLLLADEQEDMIDRYLNKGTMYVLDDDGAKEVFKYLLIKSIKLVFSSEKSSLKIQLDFTNAAIEESISEGLSIFEKTNR